MTYRDADALAQRNAIEAQLRGAELEEDERATLENDLHALDAARRREAKRHLPAIAHARIATPCGERWDTMIGEGAVRSCARCDREVFDVARMTLAEAEALVSRDACARLHVRADGTMLFADCEVGADGIRARRLRIGATAIAISSAALAAVVPVDAPYVALPLDPVLADGSFITLPDAADIRFGGVDWGDDAEAERAARALDVLLLDDIP